MQHNFDTDIAQKYGVLEAILLNNIYFWIEKNRANNVNYYDDNYWTYNSIKALSKLFPYVSEKKISYALKHLVEEGILITGNYNKSAYDRTLWYAITEKGDSILQNKKIDFTKWENGNTQNVEPIPYINTDNNTDMSIDENNLSNDFELIWELYPRKESKNTAFNHYKAWLKGKKYAGKTIKLTNKQMWYATKKYADECVEKQKEKQYIKQGSTFFNEAIIEYVDFEESS